MNDDDEAAPPDNITSTSPAASSAQAAATNNNESGTPSPHHHHHRRSKREKYSPSRFVARPSTPRDYNYNPLEGIEEGAVALKSEGPMEDNVAEASAAASAAVAVVDNSSVAAVKSDNEVTQLVDNNNNDDDDDDDDDDKKPRRRTPRAHAAPGSYVEPPDVEEDFDIDHNDGNNVDTKQPNAETIVTKTCNDPNQTILQISTIKLKNPKTNRSLCKVIGCGKADQVGNEGFCRTHFNLVHDAEGEDGDEEMEEEEIDEEVEEEEIQEEEEDKKPAATSTSAATAPSFTEVSPSKPRLNTTIRILSGEFATLTGRITNIKIGGWCTIANPKVTKPIRMSNMEVVAHNGPPPTPVKRDASYLKRKFDYISPSKSRGRVGGSGGGRPVRERKPPQSLLASPMSSSSGLSPSGRPRRLVRGGDGGGSASSSANSPYGKRGDSSLVRRSKRGPTPSPRFHHDDHDDDDDEDDDEKEVVVRPRGRRGRASASSTPSSTTTTPAGKKSVHLCKTPTCPKFRQGCCEGYCTTCYRLFKSGALFDSSPQQQQPPQPQRGGSASRNCRARNCSKFNQYNCEGYCMKHYREFVLEGGEEVEEEEEDVVSPPKKRARRAIKHEEEEEEEEEEELRDDDDDESLFDATPRTGGSGRTCRRYCKVKRCDKWSQGQPKNGMCFKHFGQYGFGDGTTMTTTKKKRSRSRSSAVAKSPAAASAAVADEIDGEIGVGSLVMVKERMGAGINKPGGVGRVTKVYSGVDDEEVTVYDVKYILGGREKGVDANSLWLHDINAKSPMKPPPSYGGEEEDVAMLDEEEDESIEDDELEGYDEFSFSQLEVPDQSVLDQRALRREEQLNALSGNNLDEDDDDHNPRLEENWECAKCGGLNRPSATSRCTTCQSYRVEKNASEDALLERTRYELLNGNDFWICTSCVIGVPSLRMPCGRCHSSIPFVPLTMPEFEDFVRNQRRIKRKREEEIQSEWDQKLEEISEEWGERKEESTTTKSKKQQRQVEWTKFPCKTLGCKEICAPDCEGFCEDHFRTVIVMEEPEAYPIVCPEDKELITDYFYLAYEQYRPCVLQDWERTRKHKDNKVQRGHPGIACRHCFGRENPTLRSMGRYFPSTENSLYQQTFTSNAVRHLLECPHCPSKVQSKLVSIKEKLDNTPSDGKKSAKFVGEKGGRGKFFRRIWCRLHRLPLDEEEAQTPKKKRSKGKHLSFQT
eukprot:CAMPEP_0113404160 /NCGR_PEP_ID=MMETSP0013_2-20120614/18232_1 /TAXON_ID=2843 ORGANISM="Skeletonema costatum, Strain 1716" /NCGR_SAMPLE_ID=MMETSP0013_2 /ASSEMBLY_ACC=CAM_ASM_000158 /LENGTH=1208 /DNA_ID=CAMNT_0000289725 /DNA_START=66 /DNA_END=3695 /DNA_ORIENTATION=- /assembly_acc=CAM_ASM_000158